MKTNNKKANKKVEIKDPTVRGLNGGMRSSHWGLNNGIRSCHQGINDGIRSRDLGYTMATIKDSNKKKKKVKEST